MATNLGLAYSIVVIVIAAGVLFAIFVFALATRKRLIAVELNNLKTRDASLDYAKLPPDARQVVLKDLEETSKLRRRLFAAHNGASDTLSFSETVQVETAV